MSCKIHIDIEDERNGRAIIEFTDNEEDVDDCFESIMHGLSITPHDCTYLEISHD